MNHFVAPTQLGAASASPGGTWLAAPAAIPLAWLPAGHASTWAIAAIAVALTLVGCWLWHRRTSTCLGRLEDAATAAAGQQKMFRLLPAHARADEVSQLLFSHQYFFPVVQGGEIVGVLSKARLLAALANGHGDRLVAELMSKGWDRTDAAKIAASARSVVEAS